MSTRFIADSTGPTDLRQYLHYLREVADLSAHTKTNDQFDRIEIGREEPDWTLSIVERLFDHFIVSPAKSKRCARGWTPSWKLLAASPSSPLRPARSYPPKPMADEKREPTQQSQPKGRDEKGEPAKPMDIPVPKRSEFDRLLDKAEKSAKPPR